MILIRSMLVIKGTPALSQSLSSLGSLSNRYSAVEKFDETASPFISMFELGSNPRIRKNTLQEGHQVSPVSPPPCGYSKVQRLASPSNSRNLLHHPKPKLVWRSFNIHRPAAANAAHCSQLWCKQSGRVLLPPRLACCFPHKGA